MKRWLSSHDTIKPTQSQRGSLHVILTVVLVVGLVVVLGVLGFRAWQNGSNNKSNDGTASSQANLTNDYQRAWNEWNIIREKPFLAKSDNGILDSSFNDELHSKLVANQKDNCTVYQAGSATLYVNFTKTSQHDHAIVIAKDACSSDEATADVVGVAKDATSGNWVKGESLMGDWTKDKFWGPASFSRSVNMDAEDRAVSVSFAATSFAANDLKHKSAGDLSKVKHASSPQDIYANMKSRGEYTKFTKGGWELVTYTSSDSINDQFCIANQSLGVWAKYANEDANIKLKSFGLWSANPKASC